MDNNKKMELFHYLADVASKDKQEIARFLYTGFSLGPKDELDIWVVKQHQRSLMEVTTKLDKFPSIQLRITYVRPEFFWM